MFNGDGFKMVKRLNILKIALVAHLFTNLPIILIRQGQPIAMFLSFEGFVLLEI